MRAAGVSVDRKPDGELVTDADLAVSRLIVARLRDAFPDDGIVSEEGADAPARADHERIWFVDPIDGSKAYAQGDAGYSVLIGLAERGRPVLGVVYQPEGDRMYAGAAGVGATLTEPGRPPRPLVCSTVADVAQVRTTGPRFGSLALRLVQIAADLRDAFVYLAPRAKTWDTCAPEAIVRLAGGRFSDPLGRPLRYSPDQDAHALGFIASNGVAHDALLARLAPLSGSR